jgi:hypothetical protein
VRKGSRLRLVIDSNRSIHQEQNYNTGGVVADTRLADAQQVNVRLMHGPDFPSALSVPLGMPNTYDW